VSRNGKSKLAKGGALFSRALSLLLLGLIVYGTTIEAAHTHGNLIAANGAIASSTFSDPASETKANGNLLGCGDCLICQLHQNFSATVIAVPPSIVPTSLTSRFSNFTAVSVHSQSTTPRTGRAPPQTSL